MGNRFSEINNSKWCKLCNLNVVEGEEHPNEEAHLSAEYEAQQLEYRRAALEKRLSETSTLIPVSSNDMLKHIAQPGSPETLCGRLITDTYRPSTTDLVCDICANLASSTSFLVNSDGEEGISDSELPSITAANYTRDGVKIEDGFTVLTNEEPDVDFDSFYSVLTYEKFANSTEFELEPFEASDSSDEDSEYLSPLAEEPIQFTAHWLEEDNAEEPLFLPNDEL